MKKKLNPHAVVAWLYIWETVKECPAAQVDKGADFRRLLCDLMRYYPDEYEAMDTVADAMLSLRCDHG